MRGSLVKATKAPIGEVLYLAGHESWRAASQVMQKTLGDLCTPTSLFTEPFSYVSSTYTIVPPAAGVISPSPRVVSVLATERYARATVTSISLRTRANGIVAAKHCRGSDPIHHTIFLKLRL